MCCVDHGKSKLLLGWNPPVRIQMNEITRGHLSAPETTSAQTVKRKQEPTTSFKITRQKQKHSFDLSPPVGPELCHWCSHRVINNQNALSCYSLMDFNSSNVFLTWHVCLNTADDTKTHNVLHLPQPDFNNKIYQISDKHSLSVFANAAHFPEVIMIIS